MEVQVRTIGQIAILDFPDRLTVGGGNAVIRETFRDSLGTGHRHFVFNLSRVPYMDSATIGETVACMKRVREQGGDLKLVVEPGGKVDQILRLTALDRIFEFFGDEEAAVASYAS
jgi:anti-anti-sigma factor